MKSQPTTTQAPTTRAAAARASLASARAQSEAKQAAVVQAKAELAVATDALMAEGNAATRAALVAAEQALSIAMVEATGAANRVERASAELEAAQSDEQASIVAKRRAACAHMAFRSAAAGAATKLAELQARQSEARADLSKLVRGFSEEATACGAPQCDYGRFADFLVARASGMAPAAILSEVWSSSVPAGMSADETLAAVESGVNPHDLARRLNTLRAGEQALSKLALAFLNRAHEQASSRADKSTLPLAQLETCAREVSATRAGLVSLGFQAASDAIKSDALASAILAASPAAVQAELVALRSAPFLPFNPAVDGETKNPQAAHAARKQAKAERAYARLESMCPAVAKLVERPATAKLAARTTTFAGHDVDVRA